MQQWYKFEVAHINRLLEVVAVEIENRKNAECGFVAVSCADGELVCGYLRSGVYDLLKKKLK
jgi:hypothetical protein